MSEHVQSPRDYLWLVFILTLALVLRVVGLDAPLWFDEIVTVDSQIRIPWRDMFDDYSMNHHYLFSVQAKALTSLFGDASWVYRLPAMLFGTGLVALVWILGRDIAGLRVANVSALLTALSYHQVWFSQNARGYTELAFFSTLGLILFLKGMRLPRPGVWLAFGLSLTAAILTHLTAAFFFLAMGIVWFVVVLIYFRTDTKPNGLILYPLAGASAGILFLLVVYAPILPQMLDTVGSVSETSSVDLMQEYQSPMWALFEGARTATGLTGPLASLLTLLALFMVLLGAVRINSQSPLFAPVLFTHIAVTLSLLTILGMRVWPRFFFVDLGLLMILATLGVESLASAIARVFANKRLQRNIFNFLTILMVVLSVSLVQRNYRAPKQNLAGAYTYAEEIRRPGERIFAVGISGPIFKNHFNADWGNLQSDDDYNLAFAKPGPITLVVPFPERSFRAIPMMDEDLNGALYLDKRFAGTLGDGSVLIFRRD